MAGTVMKVKVEAQPEKERVERVPEKVEVEKIGSAKTAVVKVVDRKPVVHAVPDGKGAGKPSEKGGKGAKGAAKGAKGKTFGGYGGHSFDYDFSERERRDRKLHPERFDADGQPPKTTMAVNGRSPADHPASARTHDEIEQSVLQDARQKGSDGAPLPAQQRSSPWAFDKGSDGKGKGDKGEKGAGKLGKKGGKGSKKGGKPRVDDHLEDFDVSAEEIRKPIPKTPAPTFVDNGVEVEDENGQQCKAVLEGNDIVLYIESDIITNKRRIVKQVKFFDETKHLCFMCKDAQDWHVMLPVSYTLYITQLQAKLTDMVKRATLGAREQADSSFQQKQQQPDLLAKIPDPAIKDQSPPQRPVLFSGESFGIQEDIEAQRKKEREEKEAKDRAEKQRLEAELQQKQLQQQQALRAQHQQQQQQQQPDGIARNGQMPPLQQLQYHAHHHQHQQAPQFASSHMLGRLPPHHQQQPPVDSHMRPGMMPGGPASGGQHQLPHSQYTSSSFSNSANAMSMNPAGNNFPSSYRNASSATKAGDSMFNPHMGLPPSMMSDSSRNQPGNPFLQPRRPNPQGMSGMAGMSNMPGISGMSSGMSGGKSGMPGGMSSMPGMQGMPSFPQPGFAASVNLKANPAAMMQGGMRGHMPPSRQTSGIPPPQPPSSLYGAQHQAPFMSGMPSMRSMDMKPYPHQQQQPPQQQFMQAQKGAKPHGPTSYEQNGTTYYNQSRKD
ncbi:hypothetical protein DIPPA_33266 [Diplonema papillatum]|nr:hypothetical protein DIPPA_33266 [Diplonema papillatum]